MAWITAGATVLSSLGGASSAKKKAKQDYKNQKKLTTLEAKLQRQNSQFAAEQDYYYKQLERKGKMRGLDEFRKFSTVKNFAPTYSNDNTGPVVPVKPEFDQGVYANTKAPATTSNNLGGGLINMLQGKT